jgi:hypothetical protein
LEGLFESASGLGACAYTNRKGELQMKKTIVLLALIFVFFSIAEVKAESYYLYCHGRDFLENPAYSRIDIIAFQNNGLILLSFNKYGPCISPQGDARLIHYEYTPAFGVFSYPYLYIFSSYLLDCKPGTTECLYFAKILTLEYGSWAVGLPGFPPTNGFILRDSWQSHHFGNSTPNTWTHHVPSNYLIYLIGYQSP